MYSRIYRLTYLVVLAAASCTGAASEPTDSDAGPTGALTLSVTGLPGTLPTDGSGLAVRTDRSGQIPFTIPPEGSVTLTVPAGIYTVGYVTPTGYTPDSPASQAGIVVPAGGAVAVTFSAKLTLAILGIVVEVASPPYPATCGSVSVERTDIPGQSPSDIEVSNECFVGTELVPGTYQVTYTPPDDFRLLDGSINPQSTAISGAATTWVTFSITH